jgi:hypothetical protein
MRLASLVSDRTRVLRSDHGQTVLDCIFDRRQRAHDALRYARSMGWVANRYTVTYGRVGDRTVLHRNIEVNTDEGSFALEVQISNGQLIRERHCVVCGRR